MTRTPSQVRNAPAHRQALVAGLLLSVGLTGCGGDSDASGGAKDSVSTMPSGDVAIEPGTYLVPEAAGWSVVDFTVTFPDGWRARDAHQFDRNSDEPDEIGILPFVVDDIYADACEGDRGAVTEVGPSAQDLVEALLAQPGPAKSDPVEAILGGYPATRIDLRVPKRLQSQDCFLGPGTGVQLWLTKPDKYLVLDAEGIVSVYVVDVNGQRQVFTTQYRPAHTSEEERAELQQVLDSIRIQT